MVQRGTRIGKYVGRQLDRKIDRLINSMKNKCTDINRYLGDHINKPASQMEVNCVGGPFKCVGGPEKPCL